ncbi:unnamed protein product [Bursaphelenchus xylophilus]|uniref:(pine wood nematode) hypothetical protein n=1 Tax=Bursaphelenchus xylophilus TaxID=6326 RepID=A0A1I7SEQ1_BURXY|nr:unnamed protein product [Bursaphelenchus xylophilus]CAG9092818.1 unnamed protein product [Bursaphelenchus xylophilus]
MFNPDEFVTDETDGYGSTYLIKLKKPKKRVKCKLKTRLFDRYFGGTEIHGLLLAFSKGISRSYQAIWITFLVITALVSAMTTRTTFDEYLEHQTATSFKIKQVLELEYPSLIICPKNPDALRFEEVIKEIQSKFPRISDKFAEMMVAYVIADSGFANMDKRIDKLTVGHHKKLRYWLRKWRKTMDVEDIHEYLFERFGYRCEDLFTKCRYSRTVVPCCEIFEEYYLMLRGRCYRLKRYNFTQTDVADRGRFLVQMRQLNAPLTSKNKKQPQVIAYLAQPRREISTYPRFYINYRAYNVITCKMRAIKMLDSNKNCVGGDEYGGRNDCYIRKWLHHRITGPLNCTVFYMAHKNDQLDTCPVGLLASNYKSLQNLSVDASDCLPACKRTEITCNHEFDEDNPSRQYIFNKNFPDFQLEYGFEDLEYEYYAEFKTTTVPGFISEIGGQFGLFLGISATSLIQFSLNLFYVLRTLFRRRQRRKRHEIKIE